MTAQTNVPARSGALTTRLNTALQRVRQALAPHGALLPADSLAEIDAMLGEFARRRIRIALYGEVKAGKSTLLNAIAGAELSPTAFDPMTSIPVRITYGEETLWRVGDQNLESAADVARLMRSHEVAEGEIVVETDVDLLQLGGQVDLLDTPGVGAEERYDAVTAEALRSLDAAVLVVRYPGLFTKATRRLMSGLQNEMGKLFVVWNLDQACADLTPAERTENTEALRANVAGAHDLFLVDARAGLDAGRRRDAAGVAASGLGAFTAALSRFVSSGGRDLAAVRETGKRVLHFLLAASRLLEARRTALENAIAEARARLNAVQADAGAAADAERARHEEFEAGVARLVTEHRATVDKLAGDLRQRLRAARRAWAWRADFNSFAEAVAVALHDHADAAAAASHETNDRLQALLAAYGAHAITSPRPRTVLEIGELAPEERVQRSLEGRAGWLRRSLFGRWYLPGLEILRGQRLNEEVAAQKSWLDEVAAAAREAAAGTLRANLAQIDERAAADQARIKDETSLAANEAELELLRRDLPVLASESEAISQLATEARSFA